MWRGVIVDALPEEADYFGRLKPTLLWQAEAYPTLAG
jgi:hypothetical protein